MLNMWEYRNFCEVFGRTQRLFMEYLASVAGYRMDFSQVSAEEMIIASADSFAWVNGAEPGNPVSGDDCCAKGDLSKVYRLLGGFFAWNE